MVWVRMVGVAMLYINSSNITTTTNNNNSNSRDSSNNIGIIVEIGLICVCSRHCLQVIIIVVVVIMVIKKLVWVMMMMIYNTSSNNNKNNSNRISKNRLRVLVEIEMICPSSLPTGNRYSADDSFSDINNSEGNIV